MIPAVLLTRARAIGATLTLDTADYVIHLIGQSNAEGRADQPSGLVNNNGLRLPNGTLVPVPDGAQYGVEEVLANSWAVQQPYLVKHGSGGISVNTWYSTFWSAHLSASQSIPSYATREHVAVWVIGETDAQNGATEAAYIADELVVFDALRAEFTGIHIVSVLMNPAIYLNATNVARVNAAKRQNAVASDVTVVGGDYSLKGDLLHYDHDGNVQMALDIVAAIAGNYVDRTAL